MQTISTPPAVVKFDSKAIRPVRDFGRGLLHAGPSDLDVAYLAGFHARQMDAAPIPPLHLDGALALAWLRGWDDAAIHEERMAAI